MNGLRGPQRPAPSAEVPVRSGIDGSLSGEKLASSCALSFVAGWIKGTKKGRARFGSALAGIAYVRVSQRMRFAAREGYISVAKRVAKPIHFPVNARTVTTPAAAAAAFDLVDWVGALCIRKSSD